MRAFRYERATDVAGAVTTVAGSPTSAFLAGGTNLVDHMRLGVTNPDLLVDVRMLTSDQIEELPEGRIRIGAGMTNSDLAVHRTIRRRYPFLSQAILSGASGQLRNMATVGGNLLQRTRCVYFQDLTTPCNKRDPGSGCSAREGFQRDNAIFGTSDSCVAVHPSDMAVAMAALDAEVHTRGPGGERTIPMSELHRLPGDEPQRDTVLERGELITAVELPALPIAANSRYRKVRDRASYAFALVSVAAALEVADGAVADVRVALGGVAHKPWRARKLEAALRGQPATEASFAAAVDAELADARPQPGNAFKVPLAHNAVVRTLAELGGAGR